MFGPNLVGQACPKFRNEALLERYPVSLAENLSGLRLMLPTADPLPIATPRAESMTALAIATPPFQNHRGRPAALVGSLLKLPSFNIQERPFSK